MGNECSTDNSDTPWKSNKICIEDPSKYVLTYSVIDNPENLSMADIEEIIAKAFETWAQLSNYTNYVFQKALPNESAEIYISFCALENDNSNDEDNNEEKNVNHDDNGGDKKARENNSKLFNKDDALNILFDMHSVSKFCYGGNDGNLDVENTENIKIIEADDEIVDEEATDNHSHENANDGDAVDDGTQINENYTTMTAKLMFDSNIPWTKNIAGEKVVENAIDLYYMALFGIGHILFMGFCEPLKDKNSIMSNEYYVPVDLEGNYIEPKLSIEDIEAIKKHFSPEKNLEESSDNLWMWQEVANSLDTIHLIENNSDNEKDGEKNESF